MLVLYVWLAPAHVVDGDNAEFATLGAVGGAAHPPGYPLYVLYLRAMSWLPGASPAHAAAIATAILGAASIVVLHAACRAWGARPLAATIACALFAGAPAVMALYTEAEVFALNGLVVAAVLLLAAERGPLRGAARLFALGLVAGLGLANHQTCVLVAPVGVLGIVRGVREASWRVLPLAVLGMVLGLLPYLYLQGHVLDYVLRRAYGGPAAFAPAGEAVSVIDNLGALAITIGRTWWWLGALAALATCIDRAARRAPGDREPRAGWAMLLASFALAGPLLALRFNVQPTGVGHYIVERFHLLPALLLAIPMADAIERMASHVSAREPAIAAVLAVLGFPAVAASALPHVARVHVPAVEMQILNTLHSLPEHAVLIGYDDDFRFGIAYAQDALGDRRDVTYIHRSALTPSAIDDALRDGRAVFVQPRWEILNERPYYPYGIVARVLPRGAQPPPLDQIVELNQQLYAGFHYGYARPGPDDAWPTVVHARYARTWQLLADSLDRAGRADLGAQARRFAAEIGPTP